MDRFSLKGIYLIGWLVLLAYRLFQVIKPVGGIDYSLIILQLLSDKLDNAHFDILSC